MSPLPQPPEHHHIQPRTPTLQPDDIRCAPQRGRITGHHHLSLKIGAFQQGTDHDFGPYPGGVSHGDHKRAVTPGTLENRSGHSVTPGWECR